MSIFQQMEVKCLKGECRLPLLAKAPAHELVVVALSEAQIIPSPTPLQPVCTRRVPLSEVDRSQERWPEDLGAKPIFTENNFY